jgi:tetratricopeptide (TPR) repeat protein
VVIMLYPAMCILFAPLLLSSPVDIQKVIDRVEQPEIDLTVVAQANWRGAMPDVLLYGPDGAVERARASAEANPNDLWAQLALADLLRQLDRESEAKAAYGAIQSTCESALAKSPEDVDALTALGWCKKRLAEKDDGGARDLFKKAVSADPACWRARMGLASVLLDSALEPLNAVTKPDAFGRPTFGEGVEAAVDDAVRILRDSEAQMDEAVGLAPDRTEPLVERAWHRLGAAGMLNWVRTTTGHGPTESEQVADVARAYEDAQAASRLKPDDLGLQCLTLVLAFAPRSRFDSPTVGGPPGFHYELPREALPQSAQADIAMAVERAESRLAALGDVPAASARLLLAMYWMSRDEWGKAQQHGETLLKLQPHGEEARVLLGLCWIARDEWAKAREQGELLLREHPDSEQGVSLVAVSYIQEGDFAALESWLKDRLTIKDTPRIRLLLGKALLKRGEIPAAVEEFSKAASAPEPPDKAHALWGYALLKRGDYGAAVAPLFEAIEREPQDADARFTYAALLIALDRPGQAREVLQQCLTLDPNHAAAKATLAELAN